MDSSVLMTVMMGIGQVETAPAEESAALLLALAIGISVLGLVCAFFLAKWVLGHSMGSEAMQKISNAIKEGAEAFLRRQNRTIILLAAAFAVVLFLGYGFVRVPPALRPRGYPLRDWPPGSRSPLYSARSAP